MRVGQDGSAARSLVLLDVRFVPPGEAPRSITLSIVDRPRPRPRPSVCWAACSTSRGGRTHACIHVDMATLSCSRPRLERGGRARFYILGPSIKLRTTMGHHTRIASQVNTKTSKRMDERVDGRARGGRWLEEWRWWTGAGGGMQIA